VILLSTDALAMSKAPPSAPSGGYQKFPMCFYLSAKHPCSSPWTFGKPPTLKAKRAAFGQLIQNYDMLLSLVVLAQHGGQSRIRKTGGFGIDHVAV
jgi:hypothetical protein